MAVSVTAGVMITHERFLIASFRNTGSIEFNLSLASHD